VRYNSRPCVAFDQLIKVYRRDWRQTPPLSPGGFSLEVVPVVDRPDPNAFATRLSREDISASAWKCTGLPADECVFEEVGKSLD